MPVQRFLPPSLLRRRRALGLTAAAVGALFGLVVLAVFVALRGPWLTPLVEGEPFRREMDRQTSKGLHFRGAYRSIRRTGTLTVATEGFSATEGVKAMRSLEARDVTAKFNPWGVLLRRWQIDYVQIGSGKVELQGYEPRPDDRPPKPWYAIFLPARVHLGEVRCAETDVTWRMEEGIAGLYGAKVRITPHGRDFEYRAEGGTLRSRVAPEFRLGRLHLLITKKILRVDEFTVAPAGVGQGWARLTGEMGMRDDQHIEAALDFDAIPLAPWLPAKWREQVQGRASGQVRWRGEDRKLAAADATGEVRVEDGRLADLPLLEYLATATRRKSLESLAFSECAFTFRLRSGRLEVADIRVGDRGIFQIRGEATIEDSVLGGRLQLGVAPAYLDWLPRAREDIFTRDEDGYAWTTVNLSGTPQRPVTDLQPRLERALRASPGAAAGLFFRGAGEWLEQKFRRDR